MYPTRMPIAALFPFACRRWHLAWLSCLQSSTHILIWIFCQSHVQHRALITHRRKQKIIYLSLCPMPLPITVFFVFYFFSYNYHLKGTVSPVYNYLKVIACKRPWHGHMSPDIKSFLTVSLICNGPVKFLCLGPKIILNYHFNFECA